MSRTAPPADPNRPWPLREAAELLRHAERLEAEGRLDPGAPLLFETGYGPSGLPHIGTFAEVARTTFIRRALASCSDRASRLITFSDDMDGLRKIPLNIPEPTRFAEHLGKPLSAIPDPFDVDPSWSAHMNRRLREFLDSFGFEYDFRSSAAMYRSGAFDGTLRLVLRHVDDLLRIVLPTLRPESREAWSPFMVVCPGCGKNLTTTVTAYHPEDDEVSFACDGARTDGLTGCGERGRSSVLGGAAKVGWKVDWALRWFTLGIHYEMYGKDLIESATLSARIVRELGGEPPIGLFYEMFLDEEGKKISKSIGKGISVDGWREYAPVQSLLAFLYANPRKARRLHWDVIPTATDQYLAELAEWEGQSADQRAWNPSFFYFGHAEPRPRWQVDLNYTAIRNLAVCMGTADAAAVERQVARYDSRAVDEDHRALAGELVRGAVSYDRDFEAPSRRKETLPASLRPAVGALADVLRWLGTTGPAVPVDTASVEIALCARLAGREQVAREVAALTAAARTRIEAAPDGEFSLAKVVQDLAFDVPRALGVEPPAMFRAIYLGLIGRERGPRFGGFVVAWGLVPAAGALDALASAEA